MKKILALSVMVIMALFSLAAIAHVITLNTIEQVENVQGLAEVINYYLEWLLIGSGLLCFIALRRMEEKNG